MKNLILRLFLFTVVYIAAGHIIKSFAPYYWGNPWWNDKMRILDRTDPKPTVYFIGSSRTYRHVIPTVFDSVLAVSGVGARSFNLGSAATFTPQTYFLLENALRKGDLPKGSTVVLDFMDIATLDSEQTSSARYTYWVDRKELSFITHSYLDCHGSRPFDTFLGPYLLAFLKNNFHISQFKGFFGKNRRPYEELDHYNSSGHLSLTKERDHYPARAVDMKARFEELRSDTSLLGHRKRTGIKIRSRNNGSACPVHLERLTALDELCSKKGVKLIHLFTALSLASDNEWATFQELPKTQRIDMGSPEAFPELYELENLFDKGHLNEKGAFLYTTYLAHEYARLLREPH